MTTDLDRRLHAFRAELADSRLRGQVGAANYVDGKAATVQAPVVDLRPAPDASRGIDTQLLRGQKVTVFDQRDGWAWVQAHADGYVGYCALDAIDAQSDAASWQPTHRAVVPATFTYQEPNLKTPFGEKLSMGSCVAVVDQIEQRGTRYAITDRGEAIIAKHLMPLGTFNDDYVAVAETLLHVPYLWGGASALGIDCSGLVQLSMAQSGHQVLRDSDMQANT
ncbi:MAG: NlpC/P60 family protein, partial [Ahrensia sp.]